jgi:DNA invertase Pin-like site-specific DNA recombinase
MPRSLPSLASVPALTAAQAEGIAKAKAAGVYRGRKPSVDAVEVKRLKAEGLGASQIAKQLKIGRASVYRVLEA